MGVWKLGGDVELEVIVVRNDGISKLNHCTAGLFKRLRTKTSTVSGNWNAKCLAFGNIEC